MNYTKLWLIMRLTTVILLITLMQVSAAGFAQKMTFVKKGATLEQIFTEIRKQTGYFVVYADNKIDDDARLDVNFKNTELKDVLDVIGNSQNLNYSFAEKNISFKPKDPSFLERIVDRLAAIDVRGRVVDENGQPLPGATVKVKGTNRSVTTNEQGQFYLQNVAEDAVLQISFVGYNVNEVNVAKDLGDIRMEVGNSDLEEVSINAGYYTTTEKLRTGNISKVTADEITNQPVTSPLLALQGRMAGVDVARRTGIPGSAITIRIRGRNTINDAGGLPLYIVDGLVIDSKPLQSNSEIMGTGYDPLSSLNVENIASIEVLKDADATAIYGSRGANGVVLITTKKGMSGKASMDFNIYRGFGTPVYKLDLLNTSDYLAMRKEALRNNSNQIPNPVSDPDLLIWDQNKNTDWQEEVFQTPTLTNVQANLSGGSEIISFRFGVGYNEEGSLVPGDFGFQKLNTTLGLNYVSRNYKLSANTTVNYGNTKTKAYNSSAFISSMLALPPNAPDLLNADGSINWGPDGNGNYTYSSSGLYNPMAATKNTSALESKSLNLSSDIVYNIIKGLNAKLNIGYNQLGGEETLKNPISAYDPTIIPYVTGLASLGVTTRASWVVEPQLAYDKIIGNHTINTLIGSTLQEDVQGYSRYIGFGFTNDALLNSLRNAPSQIIYTDDRNQYRYNAFFGRIAYNFKERYIINLTGRRDGSSRFGGNNKYGNFGAIGAAWIISNENFVRDRIPAVSFAKLRSSIGITGSDQIGDYLYYSTYVSTQEPYNGGISLTPNTLYNPDYKWERTSKLEYSLQLGFFKDRINIETSYYENSTSNQLIQYNLPQLTGFVSILRNMPATVENTGWEFVLNTRNIVGKDFSWTTSVNFTAPKTILKKFDGLETSTYASQLIVGKPLSLLRLFHFTGVNSETGLFEFEDVNKDNVIDAKDRTVIKDQFRTISGGINNSFKLRGIEVSFLMQFGKQLLNNTLSSYPGSLSNISQTDYDNRWKNPGDNALFQKITTSFDNYQNFSNYFDSDGPVKDDVYFLRLNTLSLNYYLPTSLLKPINVQNLQLFFQGTNLFTVSKSKLLDIETSASYLPPLRVFSAGLNLKF